MEFERLPGVQRPGAALLPRGARHALPRRGFAQKDPGRIGGKNYFSRIGAKTQRRPPKTRQRFASLRLCARNFLGKKHFLCKTPRGLRAPRANKAAPAPGRRILGKSQSSNCTSSLFGLSCSFGGDE